MSVCSFPGCRLLTRFIPYGREKQKAVNIGEGAHIAAAAPGGPRYDASMKPEDRASASNGIWMCCNHAHYIDVAADVISAKLLHEWKEQHESDVRQGNINGFNIRYHVACRRIKKVAIYGIGCFKNRTNINLGRVSFLKGVNGVGKSAVWQMASLFSRGMVSTIAQKRFLRKPFGDMGIELSFEDGAEERMISTDWVRTADGRAVVRNSRLSDGLLIKSIFNVIVVDDGCESHQLDVKECRDKLRSFMARLAKMLGLSLDDMYEMVRSAADRVTVVGYRIKVVGRRPEVQVDVRGDGHYICSRNLSYSELLLAELDIVVRCALSFSTDQYWLVVIESGVMNRLNDCVQLREVIFGLSDNFQILCCTSREDVVPFMLAGRMDSFEEQRLGKITVWANTKEVDVNAEREKDALLKAYGALQSDRGEECSE